MIKIVFKNGSIAKWKKKDYTDYKYDGKALIIIKNEQWVGFYNMDSVISVIIKNKKKKNKKGKRQNV